MEAVSVTTQRNSSASWKWNSVDAVRPSLSVAVAVHCSSSISPWGIAGPLRAAPDARTKPLPGGQGLPRVIRRPRKIEPDALAELVAPGYRHGFARFSASARSTRT